jgi:myo-inositol-1(or 4)-monophosphatase
MNQFHYEYKMAKSWTLQAGSMLKEAIAENIKVEYKTSLSDLVTEQDRGIENYFIHNIKKEFPDHFILGEEGQSNDREFNPYENYVWIIDPIDGTTNFIHQKRNFSISVAFYKNGKPIFGFIYDPIQEELFEAIKGGGAYINQSKLPEAKPAGLGEAVISINPMWLIPNNKFDHQKFIPIVDKARAVRYLGSAALEMAYVASGRLDAMLDFRLSSWDIAAGLIILNEVGIIPTKVNNEPIDVFQHATTLAARPNLHEELLFYLK